MAGVTLGSVPETIGWDGALAIARHLPETSATFRARHEGMAAGMSRLYVASALADLYDSMAALNYNLMRIGRMRPRRPEPYPRPWRDERRSRHIGTPMPRDKFLNWYYGGDA